MTAGSSSTILLNVMTTQAHVNPVLLSWSRQRAGLTQHALAKGLATNLDRIESWEKGEALPTFRQAQKWAATTHVPFGFLFLPAPPQEKLPLPDLRTVGGNIPSHPSVDLLETIRGVLQKQAWYLDYLKEHEQSALSFVGRFTVDSPITEVANDIRNTIAVDVETGQRSSDEYLKHLITAAERIGILVMRSGIVGNNTRRKLDVGEFRGFAISDPFAPVVFINSADAPAARLFTLLHEIAHIWIGSSGISSASPGSDRREEVFCNAVAGEFLVPQSEFESIWRELDDWRGNLLEMTERFHVSALVIARRALDIGRISQEEYQRFYNRELEIFRSKQKGGGSFYRNAGAKNSARFSRSVLREAQSGRLLLREAGRLLGIQPSKIREYAETIGE